MKIADLLNDEVIKEHTHPKVMENEVSTHENSNFFFISCRFQFFSSSGFQNFEGMINWAFLLLAMGGIRLFLENINK